MLRRFVPIAACLATLLGAGSATAAGTEPGAPAQAAEASIPACAFGPPSGGLTRFYRAEAARAERRHGGGGASRRAFSAGLAAYVYGLAPVSVRQTVQRFPENQLVSIGTLATPESKAVVLPNHDTTYTVGRLNLDREPLVIDVPDTAGRYYVIQLLDAYSNTISYIGRRTTGTRAGSYAIAGPDFSGPLPAGVRRIESPTNLVWVLGRTLVRSPQDLPAVTQLMGGYTATPLASWAGGGRGVPILLAGFPATPPLSLPSGLGFLDALGTALAENPAPGGDACLLRVLARAGIGAGRTPSSDAPDSVRAALEAGVGAGSRLIIRAEQRERRASAGANNGWLLPGPYIGDYGRNWLGRAVIARGALGANTRRETVYPVALTDSRGRALSGRHRYTLRFPRGELPPVGAFWSLTMYDDGPYLVDNPIDRYAIGDRTKGLRRARDGSLTLHIQNRPPRDPVARANWLPAPRGSLRLALRLYEPGRSVLTGRWRPPPLLRR